MIRNTSNNNNSNNTNKDSIGNEHNNANNSNTDNRYMHKLLKLKMENEKYVRDKEKCNTINQTQETILSGPNINYIPSSLPSDEIATQESQLEKLLEITIQESKDNKPEATPQSDKKENETNTNGGTRKFINKISGTTHKYTYYEFLVNDEVVLMRERSMVTLISSIKIMRKIRKREHKRQKQRSRRKGNVFLADQKKND